VDINILLKYNLLSSWYR